MGEETGVDVGLDGSSRSLLSVGDGVGSGLVFVVGFGAVGVVGPVGADGEEGADGAEGADGCEGDVFDGGNVGDDGADGCDGAVFDGGRVGDRVPDGPVLSPPPFPSGGHSHGSYPTPSCLRKRRCCFLRL